jgi:hypothetical protein
MADHEGSLGGDKAMRRRHQFSPTPPDNLESRVVLSRAGLGAHTAIVGWNPHHGVPDSQQQTVVSEINQDFGLFQNDYTQARATYLGSIQGQASPSEATTDAFSLYTTQRVSLLAQQLIGASVPKKLVNTKIMGPKQQMPLGSLARSLMETIPQPGTLAPSVSLYSLGQDTSIEAARVAILNGVKRN